MRRWLRVLILAQLVCLLITGTGLASDGGLGLKGITGPIDAAHMADVGAVWRMNWSLCTDMNWNPSSPGQECVSWIQWPEQYGSRGATEAWLVDELATWGCPSGWIGFGDEYTRWGFTTEQQLDGLHWFAGIVQEHAPSCRIVWGGWLTYHPNLGLENLYHIERLWHGYRKQYGVSPPVDAIALDHYDWCSDDWPYWCRDWVADLRAYIDMIQTPDSYGPDTQIWLRETGSLMGHEEALDAIARMGDIAVLVDRYAYFTSYYPSTPSINAFTENWRLTDIGMAYAGLGGMVPSQPKMPPPREDDGGKPPAEP